MADEQQVQQPEAQPDPNALVEELKQELALVKKQFQALKNDVKEIIERVAAFNRRSGHKL